MRPSNYNIIINVDNDVYALINSYTHAFDLVNKDVYLYLKQRKSNFTISDNSYKKLVQRGYLTSLNEDEEAELVKRITDKIHENRKFRMYNFQFIMSYDCNFRCVYCFENEVLNTSKCPSKSTITKELVDKAFEFIHEKFENKECSRNIALYGGEPFLSSNYDLIAYIVERGKKYDFKYYAPTNGYDLDTYFDFFRQNQKLFSLQITLDGTKDIQNRNRPHFKNSDSFDKITSNIDQLLKIGIHINLRINTNTFSLSKIDDLLKFFEEMGWYSYKNFSAYLALLREEIESRSPSEDNESTDSINQLDLIKAYQMKKSENLINSNVFCQDYGITNIIHDLVKGQKIPYRGYFCGAQANNILFDPVGHIYTCWDVVGNQEYKIGEYTSGVHLYGEQTEKWFNDKISDYKCIKCKYVLFCGGGCIIRKLKETDKLQPGFCNHYPQIFNFTVKKLYNEILKDTYAQI